MELAVVLLLLAGFLFAFKVLGLVFKTGFFILSIPFQIIGAAFGVVFLILLIPFATIAGILAVIFAPLLILGPLLPFLMVLAGVYFLSKN